MKATIPTERIYNAKNLSPEKEMIDTLNVVVVSGKDAGEAPITVRWYMARRSDGASPVYCSIWAGHKVYDLSGYGQASGYGYCKRSAAFEAALTSAGVTLSKSISGVGMASVRDACEAIVRAMGIRGRLCQVTN